MTTIPHDTLLAILREITKPIGEHLGKRVAIRACSCCGYDHCGKCESIAEEWGWNAAIESILDNKDIVLAVVRDGSYVVLSAALVGQEDKGDYQVIFTNNLWMRPLHDDGTIAPITLCSGDDIHSLVREAWLGKRRRQCYHLNR